MLCYDMLLLLLTINVKNTTTTTTITITITIIAINSNITLTPGIPSKYPSELPQVLPEGILLHVPSVEDPSTSGRSCLVSPEAVYSVVCGSHGAADVLTKVADVWIFESRVWQLLDVMTSKPSGKQGCPLKYAVVLGSQGVQTLASYPRESW